jgi:hypothetical protein
MATQGDAAAHAVFAKMCDLHTTCRPPRPPRAAASLNAVVVLLTGVAACSRPIAYDQAAIDANRMLAVLSRRGSCWAWQRRRTRPKAGNQNDWTDWEVGRYPDGAPHVKAGASAARAADSWSLWAQDVAAVEELGANVYRLGV